MKITRFIAAAIVVAVCASFSFNRRAIVADDSATATATKAPEKAADSENSAIVPVPRKEKISQKRADKISDRAKQGDVDLLFVGDSITDFWQNSETSNRPSGGGGKEVWEKYYGNRKAMDAGVSGDLTQHVLWRLDNGNIDNIHPKLTILLIGTNNTPDNAKNSAEQIEEGIKAIVAKLREKLPESKILLLGIFPRSDRPAEENVRVMEKIAKINEMTSKLADNKTIFYMDFGSKFLGPDGKISEEIMHDHLHPGAKGYAIWAETIEPEVAELMSEKK
jgi:lysophospholipase L1-like esterase